MSDATLRAKLTRLAHSNAELRPHILPLVSDRKAAVVGEVVSRTSDRKAGWTKGVFDRQEIESALAPVAAAVLTAKSRLNQMMAENENMSRMYGMAGMEYREEQAAARETRKMLMDAMRRLDALGSGMGRTAAWENLPEGWTEESVQSFWDSLTGDVKHKITKCMKQMEGKVTDTGAFCGSLASQVGYRAASAGTPDATTMRRAAIRVAHEDASVRGVILARMPR